MKKNYQSLEKKINIKFKNTNLLIQSLTHKSHNSLKNNEKIEFLGDRVLGLVIAKKLLEIYPDEKEGILDKKFASLVNKRTCLEIAKNINLEKYILTFNPNNKKIKKNVFLTYSDPGAVALAQRDYPDIKENIFTFKGFGALRTTINNPSRME